jgi:hypothetical protein
MKRVLSVFKSFNHHVSTETTDFKSSLCEEVNQLQIPIIEKKNRSRTLSVDDVLFVG